jgi:hypothetical protein
MPAKKLPKGRKSVKERGLLPKKDGRNPKKAAIFPIDRDNL